MLPTIAPLGNRWRQSAKTSQRCGCPRGAVTVWRLVAPKPDPGLLELIRYILDKIVFVHLLAGFKLPQIYQLAERFARLVLLRFGYLFGHLMAITVIALEAGVILHVAVSIRHYRISWHTFILRCLLHYRL